MLKQLRHWIAHELVSGQYPICCFGGWIYIHSRQWADIKFRKGWLVIRWRKNGRYAFYSPDGTPNRATWGLGNYRDD